jgi:hypothetical protein
LPSGPPILLAAYGVLLQFPQPNIMVGDFNRAKLQTKEGHARTASLE